MGLLELLGLGSKNDAIQEFKSKGAIIIDVRTTEEFKQGHISGSKNYPLSSLSSKISDIKKLNKPVIVCCQSGMRSSQAASILKNNGIDVINGGGWQSLENKL
ncbi:rhodanese-like domain-containing protein [Flavobacterium orientale]|uniref:Sulfurtransferase n=1 Tax=Flavobacterium orientale TaxID=1756020 RepID=A0A917D9P1_9FLAO|nr:rhodanese-like domain-containing protein [Flavobacterium orientale]GGD14388.1 sulfurtransferase [Flavobacterium orientale]